MKRIICLLNICLVFVGLLQAEGFVAGTLVHTQQDIVPIEQLQKHSNVIVHCGNQSPLYAVTNTKTSMVDYYIKITINNVVVCAAPDQKLYVVNKNWVRAEELVLSDLLLCCNAKLVSIDGLEVVYEQQKMHAISVEESHVYCVTKYGIIVHNIEPAGASLVAIFSPICPPVGAAIAVGEIIALGVAGFSAYLIHKKSKQDNQQNKYSFAGDNLEACPCGGKPPKHEDDKEEHPHGIYEDAGYHHKNSKKGKSPCPDNGQKCLDQSLPGAKGSEQRVSMEGDKFVVLKWTGPRKFHGYYASWEQLHSSLQKALIDAGVVRLSGKIIKEMAHKVFK